MNTVRIKVRAESYDELAVIAQRAQAFTGASGAAIALREGDAVEIVCRARAGSSAPEVGTALPVEETFTGLCIQSGKELRCDDSETDSRVDKAAMRALGIRSMVAVPLKEEGRVVGVLGVFAPTAHAFGIAHVVVLRAIADQIADYLHRTLGDGAYSKEPVPPVKAAAVSAAAAPAPPPAVVNKPAEPALTHRRRPVAPKVEPTTFAEEFDAVPVSQKKETNSYDQREESKSDFRRVFSTLSRQVFATRDAADARENRPGVTGLMIGAAAVVVIVVAVGLSLKLRKPAAAPQPTMEASSLPAAPAAPAPASVNVQPPEKNTAPAPPVKDDEPRPKRQGIVVLSTGPSKISLPPGARDNSAPMSDAPATSLANVPASGSLSSLVSPVSQPPRLRVLTQSDFEPVTAIKRVPPVYPMVAKQRRLSGSVVVQGTVSKNGKISDLQLISGSPVFRDAAFAALQQWVFKPARLNGQAIEQSTTIRLHFTVP
jgi:TonB family protein